MEMVITMTGEPKLIALDRKLVEDRSGLIMER